MAKRLVNLERHNRDPKLQALALAVCAGDVVRWFNDWVWTYDPRIAESPFLPMDLFPKQAQLLLWLGERERSQEDGLVPKSRDMGLTWLCIGFLVHRWLFREGFKGAIGSRKETLVDRLGDPDSIFEKARMLLRRLPAWMLPAGFDWNVHDNFCKLINPANGSTITGEAGDNIGRGGRSSIYFIDEAAFIERPERVDAALSANTNCRIYVSTHNGPNSAFNRKRESGHVAVFEFTWRDDPRKNRWELVKGEEVLDSGPGGTELADIPAGCILRYPWYEAEKKRLADPVIIAQEIDCDPNTSVEGVVIPTAWVKAAVNFHRRFGLKPSAVGIVGLDVADGGDAETALVVRRGPIVDPVQSRRERGTTDTANWALDLALAAKARVLNYDAPGVGAGIAGQFKARARLHPLGIATNGVNTGAPPTERVWASGKTSKEQFLNLKAELWWILRSRFEKTYEAIVANVDHPLDELISIPDDPILIRQLSSQRYNRSEVGKYFVLSKKSPEMRGIESPDRADALVLTFAPVPQPVRAAVGGERRAVTTYTPR